MSQMNVAPSVPTMPVNMAPAEQAEQHVGLARVGGSRLIITSTPTWMPVRTP